MHTDPRVSPESLPPTIDVEQAAELLGVSRSSGYRGIARGEIPAIRIGGRIRVPTAKLLRMLGVGSAQAANANGTSIATPNRSVNGERSTPSPRA